MKHKINSLTTLKHKLTRRFRGYLLFVTKTKISRASVKKSTKKSSAFSFEIARQAGQLLNHKNTQMARVNVKL